MSDKKKIIITIICAILVILLLAIILILAKPKEYESNAVGIKQEEPVTYTITFNTDGGTLVGSQIVKKGYKIIRPENPTKEGYDFVDWTHNGEIYNFETRVHSNMELKAVWFDLNYDGNLEIPEVPGNEIDEPNTVPKDEAAEEPENKPIVKPPTNVETIKYTVKFNSNGGSKVSSQSIVKGNKAIKPTNPVRPGYRFNSWMINGKNYNFKAPVTSNITLSASWIPIEYTIKYELSQGTANNPTKYTVETKPFKLNNPTRANAIFKGWTGSNGAVPKTDVQVYPSQLQNLEFTANWLLYGDANLDQKVDAQDAALLEKVIKKTANISIDAKPLADLNADNKITYLDMEILLSFLNKKITKVPFKTSQVYTIRYNTGGGSPNTMKYEYAVELIKIGCGISLPTPTKEGYNFKGWRINNSKKTFTSIPTTQTGNITLTAVWEKKDDEED